MPSFDVVSRVDAQEVSNAVNNANKEISTRFDFRNTNTEVEWDADASLLKMDTDSEGRLDAAFDVLQSHLVRRGISLKTLERKDPKPAGGARVRQEILVQQGIAQDKAKKVVKDLKDSKIKVQSAIQGEELRITGKKRDDLQAAIALLKANDYGVPLQFVNFRE